MFPLKPKANSGLKHPVRNLGPFAHPPKPKDKHVTTKVPHPTGDPITAVLADKNDFHPTATPMKNMRTTERMVNQPGLDASDSLSEAVGSAMGPQSGTAPIYSSGAKPKKKKLSGMPFFGKM